MTKTLQLSVGALGPTISEQVAAQGFTTALPVDQLDRLEHSIHLLRIKGLLTHSESDRAIKRLIREMRARPATTEDKPHA